MRNLFNVFKEVVIRFFMWLLSPFKILMGGTVGVKKVKKEKTGQDRKAAILGHLRGETCPVREKSTISKLVDKLNFEGGEPNAGTILS